MVQCYVLLVVPFHGGYAGPRTSPWRIRCLFIPGSHHYYLRDRLLSSFRKASSHIEGKGRNEVWKAQKDNHYLLPSRPITRVYIRNRKQSSPIVSPSLPLLRCVEGLVPPVLSLLVLITVASAPRPA